ncbi:MAG: FAD:protein FMN transferase [bacterium]
MPRAINLSLDPKDNEVYYCAVKRFLLGTVFFLLVGACSNRIHEVDQTEIGFGSYFRICGRGKKADEVRKTVHQAFAEMHRLDTLWSNFVEKSEVVRLNRVRKMIVSADTRELIEKAVALCAATGGALDITVEPLVRLWGFYDHSYRVPESSELKNLLRRVDYHQVAVRGDTVVLGDGVTLDLGGVAVGYAVDRIVEILLSGGLSEGLVDAGGDIRVFGDRVWRIGVQHPRREGVIRVLKLKNRAVSTSGDYEQFFEVDGRRYCHIINPKTGYPGSHWVAVTVLAPTALEADGYATALFVLEKKGIEVLQAQPQAGALFFEAQDDSVIVKEVGLFNE